MSKTTNGGNDQPERKDVLDQVRNLINNVAAENGVYLDKPAPQTMKLVGYTMHVMGLDGKVYPVAISVASYQAALNQLANKLADDKFNARTDNMLNAIMSSNPSDADIDDALIDPRQEEINNQHALWIKEQQEQGTDLDYRLLQIEKWTAKYTPYLPTVVEIEQSLRPTKSDNRGRRVIIKVRQWLKGLVGR